MERKQRIQQLLSRLSEIQRKRISVRNGGDLGKSIEEMLNNDKAPLYTPAGRSPAGQALMQLAEEVTKVKKDPRIGRITQALKKADQDNETKRQEMSAEFETRLEGLLKGLETSTKEGRDFASSASRRASQEATEPVTGQVKALVEEFTQRRSELENKDSLLASEIAGVQQSLSSLFDEVGAGRIAFERTLGESSVSTEKKIAEALTELENRINRRLSAMQGHGGGNANRNIAIGGNGSVTQMFTDINLIAGNNVTLTYQNNTTTKYLDVTISATGGGGGSVTGITRQISTIAVNTAAGAAAGVDYVYLASGTITVTLPTTVGNKNLYTVKNIGAGIVTVDTTGGETIDGSPTVVMPIQFTSVDLISNNSGNWDIT